MAKDDRLIVRITAGQKASYSEKANKAGKSLSEWVTGILDSTSQNKVVKGLDETVAAISSLKQDRAVVMKIEPFNVAFFANTSQKRSHHPTCKCFSCKPPKD